MFDAGQKLLFHKTHTRTAHQTTNIKMRTHDRLLDFIY